MQKIAVIKFGGHSFKEKKGLDTLIYNIKYLKKLNYKIIICHGGTPSVEEKLNKEKIDSQFVNGYRVTTKKIMNIVEEAILGSEVLEITNKINLHNLSAISLNGHDAFCIRCHKKKDKKYDYGYVGEINDINIELISTLIDKNYIPVISPIGCDDLGNSYNLNSDYLASEIAKKINADLLLMITNVNGIYEDINKPETRIPIMNYQKADEMYKKKLIYPTMKTKLDAVLNYVKTANNISYIIDSYQKINYSLFKNNNIGTKVVPNEYQIRLALKEDIPNIIKLTKLSFKKYQENIKYKIAPLLESKDDVYQDILNKYVFVLYHNDILVGSARAKIDKDYLKISRICIHPDYQKNGYGSILLRHIEKMAYQKGITAIGLTTLNNVSYLENFYLKNKYRKILINTSRGYERSIMIKDISKNINSLNIYNFIKE